MWTDVDFWQTPPPQPCGLLKDPPPLLHLKKNCFNYRFFLELVIPTFISNTDFLELVKRGPCGLLGTPPPPPCGLYVDFLVTPTLPPTGPHGL